MLSKKKVYTSVFDRPTKDNILMERYHFFASCCKKLRCRVFSNIHFSFCLTIVILNVQDDLDNITRYLILAREPIIPGIDKPHKTSIVFTLEEGPRVLFNALAVFALREINLSKVTFSTTTFYLSR
uniref:ACT domain-containing protein n=1 Tax=Lactuca sativa TaxID=4236 RepID=A0A9R1XKB4_LACSA|nr:hypothetical protein LSAT_V11C400197480 [Lactuca sativa]